MEWNVYGPKVVEDATLGQVVVEVGYSLYQKFDAEVVQGAHGSVTLAAPNPSSFTALGDLSKDTVVSWVKQALGEQAVADMERKLSELVAKREESVPALSQAAPAAFSW
jgi:hypothetical protein